MFEKVDTFRTTQKCTVIDARETAGEKATEDMYVEKPEESLIGRITKLGRYVG